MIIAHNLTALNTYKSLGIASGATAKSMEKLSSGYRINRAGDDAAGLSISEKMRSQIRGLNRASRNAQDGISMIQTAEGALNEQHSILQRMRELAVQSATDTNADVDRAALQNEMSQLTSEINRIGNTTEFNGMKLLDGSMTSQRTGSTTTAVAKEGSIKLQNAVGIEKTDGGIKIKDGIKLATSSDGVDFNKLKAADTANTISVEKDGDTFKVNITLEEDGSGNKIHVESEEMIKNDDGSYTYDNHGISFTISAEDAKEATDGATVTLDLHKAKGAEDGVVKAAGAEFGTVTDYEDGGDLIQVSDFKLSEYGSTSQTRLDFAKVKIEVVAGSGNDVASTLRVSYFKDPNADVDNDDPMLVDEITNKTTVATAGDAFKYDANGVSFTIKTTGDAKDATMEAIINLDEKLGTENIEIGGTVDDKSAYFHVGANSNQTINMSFGDMRAASLGIVANAGGQEGFSKTANVTDGVTNNNVEYSLDISTREGANKAIDIIDSAIQKVSDERSKYGAIQNRLEYTINNLNTSAENLQAAESRIRDVDMASEMMELTKNNILQQAAQAMLVQANQTPQQALQLLQ